MIQIFPFMTTNFGHHLHSAKTTIRKASVSMRLRKGQRILHTLHDETNSLETESVLSGIVFVAHSHYTSLGVSRHPLVRRSLSSDWEDGKMSPRDAK